MAKTYPAIGPFTAGDIITAATMTDVQTNLTNQRVPPMCRAVRSTNQSFANGALAAVNFDAEDFATDGMFAPTRNYIEAQTTGIYGIDASLQFQSNGVGQRAAVIIINPTFSGSGDSAVITAGTRAAGSYTNAVGSGIQTSLSVSSTFSLAGGDTVALLAFQNAGGPLSFTTGVEQTALSLTWLGQVS